MIETKLDWNNILTKDQRARLIETAVKFLTCLVDSEEITDFVSDLRLGYSPTLQSSLFLTFDGLKEIHSYLSADWDCWKTERYELSVSKDAFGLMAERYKLDPEKIEEIHKRLKG